MINVTSGDVDIARTVADIYLEIYTTLFLMFSFVV